MLEYRVPLASGGFGQVAIRSNSLSWSDHRLLEQSAVASSIAAAEMVATRQVLEELRYDVSAVAKSVDRMEYQLGLRLDAQTAHLAIHSELLAEIAGSLRSPHKTLAAEQVAAAGLLLGEDRFDRALSQAQKAVENDPANRGGFLAAGWACLSLDRPLDARTYLREAAQCGSGDEPHSALRQAARLTFVLEGPAEAQAELSRSRATGLSEVEIAATHFDHAIYAIALGQVADACSNLRFAARQGRGFALMALADPVIASAPEAVDVTREILSELDGLRIAVRDAYSPGGRRLESSLATLQTWRDVDETSGVIEHLSTVLAGLNELLLAGTSDWGYAALEAALSSEAVDYHPAIEAAAAVDKYVAEQRAMLSVLSDKVAERHEVPITAPRKLVGVWTLYSTPRKGPFRWWAPPSEWARGAVRCTVDVDSGEWQITQSFPLDAFAAALGVNTPEASDPKLVGANVKRLWQEARDDQIAIRWPYCE